MPESQNSNFPTDSTLAKLLEADSQLSAQETQLQAQLKSIHEKRQSLQVVISLFSQGEQANLASISIPKTPSVTTIDESPSAIPLVEASPVDIAPTPKKGKKAATPAFKKKQTQKTRTSKISKHSPGWHRYLKEEFHNHSLPQAIASVLETDVERVWDCSGVVDAMFIEEIPHEVKKKVRLQINNLLAQGARDNKWYRGQQGCYSLSKEAAKA